MCLHLSTLQTSCFCTRFQGPVDIWCVHHHVYGWVSDVQSVGCTFELARAGRFFTMEFSSDSRLRVGSCSKTTTVGTYSKVDPCSTALANINVLLGFGASRLKPQQGVTLRCQLIDNIQLIAGRLFAHNQSKCKRANCVPHLFRQVATDFCCEKLFLVTQARASLPAPNPAPAAKLSCPNCHGIESTNMLSSLLLPLPPPPGPRRAARRGNKSSPFWLWRTYQSRTMVNESCLKASASRSPGGTG